MNAPALPAYLQSRQSAVVKERAAQGLGTAMPPHISIQGNQFTLIDAAGNEQTIGSVMDACVVDVSDVNCKKYFGKEWTPDSNDAPMCWSANGTAPSREAQNPQALTCAACPHNVRGSAVSKISGAAIKACRDEKWLALIIPAYPQMLFQLVLTPGSFTNWKAYLAPFEQNKGTDISDVLTRISFEPKVNGVLSFQATAYIDEGTYQAREKAALAKATDVLVGRNDVPRTAALEAPQQPVAQIAAQPAESAFGVQHMNAPQVQQPAPFQPAQTAAQPFTPTAPQQAQPSQTTLGAANPVSPSEPAPQQRRKRRTQAEMQAAQVPAQAPQSFAQPAAPAMAPFRPEAQGQPAQPASFGIQQPAALDPGLNQALDSIFGKAG